MSPIDERNRLDENPFDFMVYKNRNVQIFYKGRPVMLLKDRSAQDLAEKLDRAEGKEVQLILAKITGNFKHGNEKLSKKKK